MGGHEAFRDAVEAGDIEGAIGVLAPDVVFRSPAVYAPYEGREATADVLRVVAQVFEDFRYIDELDAGDRIALIFEARVGEREIQGLDYIRVEDGQIAELTVMIRPFSGLQAVAEAVGRLVAQQATPTP